MICWVVERALSARNVSRAIVATDDERILDAVKSAGYEAVMTRADHQSGTDRIAEVAVSIEDADIIVNLQGDEPLISPLTIERAVEEIWGKGKGEEGNRGKGEGVKGNTETKVASVGIVTTWEPMESAADVLNPDVVKVVVDDNSRALYFSRLPVPYPRDAVRKHGSIEVAIFKEPGLLTNFRKHTGLYVYRRDVLLAFQVAAVGTRAFGIAGTTAGVGARRRDQGNQATQPRLALTLSLIWSGCVDSLRKRLAV